MLQQTISRPLSSRHREDLPLISQTPSITSFYHSESTLLDQSNKNLNLPTNPLSPMSISSAGTLPSPLFDKDIFEAFPSVPDNTPSTSKTGRSLPLRHEQSLAASTTADFDSALLSSAIHLASSNTTHTSTLSVPTASAGRAVTPTQLSLHAGEPSAV